MIWEIALPIVVVTAAIAIAVLGARSFPLFISYDPTLMANFTPHGILLSGFGWPPGAKVRLSVWNEPFEESGDIYNSPPRVLAEIEVNGSSGHFEYTMPFPAKVRGRRPPHFRDVFFLAYNRKWRIVREAKMWNGSDLWFHP